MPKAKSVDGVRIHYQVDGAGPPLVLIPGAFGTVLSLNELVEELRDERTLVCIDPRGRGKSDKPQRASQYAWRMNAADVIAVVDALGYGPTDMFGYSQGGITVLAVLSAYGHHVRSAVAGGALVPPPENHELFQSQLGIANQLRERGMEMVSEYLDFYRPNVRADEAATDWLDRLRNEALHGNLEAYIAEFEGHSSLDGTHPPAEGPPTLLFAGSDDALPATLSRRAAERLSYMTYREFPGLDHLRTNLRLDLIGPMLREFWSSLE